MKKAFAWLEGNRIEYTFHDYKKDGVPGERLRHWLAQEGWERIVNTRGPTFRKLPPGRQQGLDAKKAAALLEEFPSAIKRPVVESGKQVLVGFDPAAYAKALAR